MKRAFLILSAAFFAASALAQQPMAIPTDPEVRVGQLDNGLTYFIRHNEEPIGQANFYIAQKVGSILEDEDQRGLAHFLEHMCFNGTEHFPGNGIIKYCESIGVKFGANLNAYTSIDETVYNIDNVPVGNVPSAIDSCLWILHDWADGLLLEGDDIDHERGVIHEEWRSRMNNATLRLYEKILPEVYPGNRYGERMPIGLMSVVDNFPYDVLRNYYEKWYRPDQQGIVIVGDIDVDSVEAKVKDIFGTIAKPENPAERFYVQIEDNAEPIISMATDKEQQIALTYIMCKHDPYPVESRNSLEYLIYNYATQAAAIMMHGRMQEILQKADAPFIDGQIGDGEFLLSKTKSAWTGVVATSEEGLEKGVTSVYREMLRAVRGGFTESEYERARAEILSQLETAYNQMNKKKSGEYCREIVRHFIDNEPMANDEQIYNIAQQLAPNIPVALVNQIIGSFVKEGNLVVACMLPEKEGVSYPTVDELRLALEAVAAENIEAYVDAVCDEPLIATLPAAGRIVKSADFKFGYRKYTLSNGAVVYIKKTDFNADEILFRAFSNGGLNLYPESALPTLKVVEELATIGGVGNFSNSDLIKAMSGKQASVKPVISYNSEAMKGFSTPKDFETMLQLNYLYFTSLRKDDEAFASWKKRSAASIANRENQPIAAFQDSLRHIIYDKPARIMALTSAEIEGVDYDKALEIAAERFANAADFTFVFTGNIDEETALPLIEKYIGSLPGKGKKEKPNTKAFNFRKGVRELEFERKMELPMAIVCYENTGNVKFSPKTSIAYDIALNALSVLLLEEIREKEGGTYSIQASGDMSAFPKQEANMDIIYQTDPDKYVALNARIEEIVDEFLANGPRESDLSKAKEYLLKKYKENIRENSYWSSVLSEYLQAGFDLDTAYEEMVRSITADDARKALKSVVEQNNCAKVIMVGTK